MRMLQSVFLFYLIIAGCVGIGVAVYAGSVIGTIAAIVLTILFIVRLIQHGKEST